MLTPDAERNLYEFGAFRLDPEARLLLRDGTPLHLQPKTFEALLLLVEAHGRTLSKDELMAKLWPDCVVEEGSLTQLMFQARRALNEETGNQQYIKTVPRYGYRFVADVRIVKSEPQEIIVTHRHGATIRIEEEDDESAVATVQEKRVTKRWSQRFAQRRVWAVLACLVAIPVLLVWWIWTSHSGSDKPLPQMSLRRLTASGQAARPALSPDGKYAAYVVEATGQQSLWVAQAAAANAVQITQPSNASISGLVFSPDGQALYYVSTERGQPLRTLYRVPVLGGASIKITDDVDSGVSFSPDGKQFAFVRFVPAKSEFALMTANVDGTDERQLAARQLPEFFATEGLAWSPDGNVIACAAGKSCPIEPYVQVFTVRVADGAQTKLNEQSWNTIGQLAWLKDGSGLIAAASDKNAPVFADQLWQLAYPGGTARRITNDLNHYDGVGVAGKELVTTQANRIARFWIVPANDPSRARPMEATFSDNDSEMFGLDWTLDGRLVFGSHRSGNADLWMMNADGKDARQLTAATGRDTMPVVSADGRVIVFVSQTDGAHHLWRMQADGSGLQQLTNGKGEHFPSLSPDGRWVVYSSVELGISNPTIWKIALDGGAPEQLTNKNSVRPVVSPDGQWIACFYQDETARRNLVSVLPFAGGEPVKVFRDLPFPDRFTLRWTPDSRALTFIVTREGVSNLWTQPLDGGAPRQLTDFTTERIFRFAWSRDGQQLAVERGQDVSDVLLIKDFQ